MYGVHAQVLHMYVYANKLLCTRGAICATCVNIREQIKNLTAHKNAIVAKQPATAMQRQVEKNVIIGCLRDEEWDKNGGPTESSQSNVRRLVK